MWTHLDSLGVVSCSLGLLWTQGPIGLPLDSLVLIGTQLGSHGHTRIQLHSLGIVWTDYLNSHGLTRPHLDLSL